MCSVGIGDGIAVCIGDAGEQAPDVVGMGVTISLKKLIAGGCFGDSLTRSDLINEKRGGTSFGEEADLAAVSVNQGDG